MVATIGNSSFALIGLTISAILWAGMPPAGCLVPKYNTKPLIDVGPPDIDDIKEPQRPRIRNAEFRRCCTDLGLSAKTVADACQYPPVWIDLKVRDELLDKLVDYVDCYAEHQELLSEVDIDFQECCKSFNFSRKTIVHACKYPPVWTDMQVHDDVAARPNDYMGCYTNRKDNRECCLKANITGNANICLQLCDGTHPLAQSAHMFECMPAHIMKAISECNQEARDHHSHGISLIDEVESKANEVGKIIPRSKRNSGGVVQPKNPVLEPEPFPEGEEPSEPEPEIPEEEGRGGGGVSSDENP